jgi:hypothetical protein
LRFPDAELEGAIIASPRRPGHHQASTMNWNAASQPCARGTEEPAAMV